MWSSVTRLIFVLPGIPVGVTGLDSALLYALLTKESENGTSEFVWEGAGYVGP